MIWGSPLQPSSPQSGNNRWIYSFSRGHKVESVLNDHSSPILGEFQTSHDRIGREKKVLKTPLNDQRQASNDVDDWLGGKE